MPSSGWVCLDCVPNSHIASLEGLRTVGEVVVVVVRLRLGWRLEKDAKEAELASSEEFDIERLTS